MTQDRPQTMGEFMAFTRPDVPTPLSNSQNRDVRSNERDAGREKDEVWWVRVRDDVPRQV